MVVVERTEAINAWHLVLAKARQENNKIVARALRVEDYVSNPFAGGFRDLKCILLAIDPKQLPKPMWRVPHRSATRP